MPKRHKNGLDGTRPNDREANDRVCEENGRFVNLIIHFAILTATVIRLKVEENLFDQYLWFVGLREH